jgi:hypothetical protein
MSRESMLHMAGNLIGLVFVELQQVGEEATERLVAAPYIGRYLATVRGKSHKIVRGIVHQPTRGQIPEGSGDRWGRHREPPGYIFRPGSLLLSFNTKDSFQIVL